MDRLKDKVALVTGAARPRGIGYSIAKLYASEGAIVIIDDILGQVMDRVKELQSSGYKAIGYTVDLTKLNEVNEMVKEILDKFGKIDILCNAAGKAVPPRPAFIDMSEEYWDMVIDRNLRTTFCCCKTVVPSMVEQKYGKIVNISSVTGPRVVYRYCAAYAASKGAVSAFTRALALELGQYNITVNAILPGTIDTFDKPRGTTFLGSHFLKDHNASPISKPGMPEDVADLALFLSTDESKYLTGVEILIDGGATIVERY